MSKYLKYLKIECKNIWKKYLLSLLLEDITVEDAVVVSVEGVAGDLPLSESDLESSALDERLDLLYRLITGLGGATAAVVSVGLLDLEWHLN